MDETLALIALAAMIVAAVARPFGVPEAFVALPAVGLLLLVGAVSVADARHEIHRLAPVVGFLAAILVIAECAGADGMFRAAGGLLARAGARSARCLLLAGAGLASAVTALLSLDTTAVLLTPVMVSTLRTTKLRPRPHLYLTAHLASSASLLLPVSNLTNLIAVAVVSVSFTRFAALMALPWLLAIAIDVLGVRVVFDRDLAGEVGSPAASADRWPVATSVIVAITVVGFPVGSVIGVAPVWIALAGAAVLAGRRLLARRTSVGAVIRSASLSFCVWVLGLGVVVAAVSAHGLGSALERILPDGTGFASLLAIAAVSAVLANVVNNLPATLLVIPVVAAGGVAPALAALVGLNIGPNLTYPGSLSTLLWRRATADVPDVPTLRDFTALGLLTVPIAIVGSTAALWLGLQVIGT
ncbi:MAG TPA: SLC13 family permease [Mycobacteriales bacterium]|nr:SLC13 family permease [Mycobacteriales bacterium]